jgi:hypothetical protein
MKNNAAEVVKENKLFVQQIKLKLSAAFALLAGIHFQVFLYL